MEGMQPLTIAQQFSAALKQFDEAILSAVDVADRLRELGEQGNSESRDLAAILAGGLLAVEASLETLGQELSPMMEEYS